MGWKMGPPLWINQKSRQKRQVSLMVGMVGSGTTQVRHWVSWVWGFGFGAVAHADGPSAPAPGSLLQAQAHACAAGAAGATAASATASAVALFAAAGEVSSPRALVT